MHVSARLLFEQWTMFQASSCEKVVPEHVCITTVTVDIIYLFIVQPSQILLRHSSPFLLPNLHNTAVGHSV